MRRQLTAFVTCLALVVSGLTATAADARGKKNDNDVLKLMLGAAAVGILLNQMNQGQARPVQRPVQVPRFANPTPEDDSNQYRPYQRPDRSRFIPAECVMQVEVNGRLRDVVSRRCVSEMGLARRMPADCAFDIYTYGGTRTVYGERCLRNYGYRIEAAGY